MSLDRAIAQGQERRRPYRDSRRFDRTCRNHGSCSWCERNRTIGRRRLNALLRLQDESPDNRA